MYTLDGHTWDTRVEGGDHTCDTRVEGGEHGPVTAVTRSTVRRVTAIHCFLSNYIPCDALPRKLPSVNAI